MIVVADARKGLSGATDSAAQSSKTATQTNDGAFGALLATLGPQGSGDDSPAPVVLEVSARGSDADANAQRDPAAEDGLAAILAAWFALAGGRPPAAPAASVDPGQAGLQSEQADPLRGQATGALATLLSGVKETGGSLKVAGSGEVALVAALMTAVNGGVGPVGQQALSGLARDRSPDSTSASLLAAFMNGSAPGTAVSLAASSALLPDTALFSGGGGAGASPSLLTQPNPSTPDLLGASGLAGQGDPARLALAGIAADFLARAAAGKPDSSSGFGYGTMGSSGVGASPTSLRALGAGNNAEGSVAGAGELPAGRFSELLVAEARQRTHLESSDALLAGSTASAQGLSAQATQPVASFATPREALANARALEGSVSWLASQHGGAATIDLSPPELGSLRIELKVDAAGTNATLVVHAASDAARVAVEQALDRLYEAFQSSGMSLSVSVGNGSGSFTDYMPASQGGDQRSGFASGDKPALGLTEAPGIFRGRAAAGSDGLSLYA